ncbi:saccharopine dehydrogenase NADP-binding domain-containing protein [Streptomyces sp. NEAU-sy36]|uniref:saccharopine dehydrogenase NADP-binding domain-containing protein n=1 Tax=unclassified Streptomyces TaxID=2593676 RepID=UPI0015D6575B|nr:saccharopine dehydrogenase NADP-binding domain-containing protein [Streptomyces sp. NEAU-sy36]QLJ00381.1 saccharopine dehydrogenase NADP-binding domain-containing protein [Streptomyces sp. NEAU-sy36]
MLRELLARGETPTLVGRSRAKLLALSEDLRTDLDVVEADATSTADLTRIVDRTDVVVSTVGPFTQLGLPAVTAAARAGARYLDSTGEPPFIREAFALDAVATAGGASVVPAFGYDYVPGNLAGALALAQAGEQARRVEIGYFLTRSGHGDETRYRGTLRDAFTLTTGGTRASLVGSAVEDTFAYRRPRTGGPARLTTEHTGARLLAFHHAGTTRTALTVGGSEHLGLPEAFPHLDSVDVGLGWFGRSTPVVQTAIHLAAPLLHTTAIRGAVTRLSRHLPGSTREPDTDGRALVIAVARDAAGRTMATTALTGPDPYEMTGSLLAWGASHAAAPDTALTPGVHGPVTAIGLQALRDGAAQAGLREAA